MGSSNVASAKFPEIRDSAPSTSPSPAADRATENAQRADPSRPVGSIAKVVKSFLVLGLGLVACSKSEAAGLPRTTPGASVEVARQATAPLAQNPRDIAALFANELGHRPRSELPVEGVWAGLERTGIPLSDQRQHLARPYGARYCVGARAGRDVALSVCEYVDAEAARAGADISRKIPLKDREVHVNRATSLTVRLLRKTPESEGVASRLLVAFTGL